MEFMPEHAPLVVLTFLGSVFVLGAAVLAALFGALRKHWRLELGGIALAAALVSVYALLLLGVSRATRKLSPAVNGNISARSTAMLEARSLY